MNCPGCGNETRSVVEMCLKCGWQSPTLHEPPREVPRGIDPGYIYGPILIAVGLGLTSASYFLQRSAGQHQYAVFYGLMIAGVFRMLLAVARNWKG